MKSNWTDDEAKAVEQHMVHTLLFEQAIEKVFEGFVTFSYILSFQHCVVKKFTGILEKFGGKIAAFSVIYSGFNLHILTVIKKVRMAKSFRCFYLDEHLLQNS